MDTLQSVFNHLVLPPVVPSAQDTNIDAVSRDVFDRVAQACASAVKISKGTLWESVYSQLSQSLTVCGLLNTCDLEKSALLDQFRRLTPGLPLILHIKEQNSCLIIRQDVQEDQQYVTFESFEASPTTEQVLATTGHALQWDFPGRCAQIPLAEFMKKSFQEGLASFLEHACMETIGSLQATAKKAGVHVEEIRDTTDPSLITHMLMAIIEAMGRPVQPPILRKKIRDDVNFDPDNLPWRRLPFWLVLRVAVQRHLCLVLGNKQGQFGYKALVAIVLTQLLGDVSGRLSPHSTDRLRRKLVRRMAKMETDRQKLAAPELAASQTLLAVVSSMTRRAVEEMKNGVGSAWDEFKQKSTRIVRPLPTRATTDSLQLRMENSQWHLREALNQRKGSNRQPGPMSLPNPLDQNVSKAQQFTDGIHQLATMEQVVEKQASCAVNSQGDYQANCVKLAKELDKVMNAMRPEYEGHPEQMSAMILSIFTLWTELDKCASAACPILLTHRPAFRPELLDSLQLPTKRQMVRLHDIQGYLASRHAKSQHGSVLEIASSTSFAVHYYNQSNNMQKFASEIQSASDVAAEATKKRMNDARNKYNKLTEEISILPCQCVKMEDGRTKVKGCPKHRKILERSQLKIQKHEAYLPTNTVARCSLAFELSIPSYISAYRDATWRIISELAHPCLSRDSARPVVHLSGCDILRPFMAASVNRLSLASSIKCFSQSHYKLAKKGGVVAANQVILPFAAMFRLFDNKAQVWVDDLRFPLTLEHVCGVYTPQALLSVLPADIHPPTIVDRPSSYEIQANEPECPHKMSIHEFSALQKLMSGKRRRWPNMLAELTSTNINISNEETMLVMSQLAIQAGPTLQEEPLRAAHELFKDEAFAKRLCNTVRSLLGAIKSNWREHNCMELIITLILRLLSLSPTSQAEALSLLRSSREALITWIETLRLEVHCATDAKAAQQSAKYGLHAALLCRRTFTSFVDSDKALNREDLEAWIQCSLALQENVLHDTNKLGANLRGMLIRDAKMSFRIENQVKGAMNSFRSAVGVGISKVWGHVAADFVTSLSSWIFLPGYKERWIVTTTPNPHPQRIHFDFMQGHLLVDGKPREKLPVAILEDKDIQEIFGNQHLLTYPSSLPGMSHQLAQSAIQKVQVKVHFGVRNGCAVMRTHQFNHETSRWELLEFVPRRIFSSAHSFDLPDELVSNCAHWLNLNTACLEIRRATPGSRTFWLTRERDWKIDLNTRIATRGKSNLVDPNCVLATQISKIFESFEERGKLTIYQPRSATSKLSVALKHMDLLFEVNSEGWLECRELNALVDDDQDAGSWYGLRSMIVLRNLQTRSRTVLVPLGIPNITRNGLHVDVYIYKAGDSGYGSYNIDSVLGRFSCKPEPRLVYTKALYHAITSFCVPDPLTNRTGSEEASAILQSGAAQPWTPLPGPIHDILDVFDRLAPTRKYYPPPLKRLQTVEWDHNLTPTIQLDGYRPMIQSIRKRSKDIATFHVAQSINMGSDDPATTHDTHTTTYDDVGHLYIRGMHQRNVYERSMNDGDGIYPINQAYRPRDRHLSAASARVYGVTCAVLSGDQKLRTKSRLIDLLKPYDVIGGFPIHRGQALYSKSLSSLLETPINEQWGELVRLCQESGSKADLLFLLGLLAFNKSADMDIIYTLAAFGSVDRLRCLQPPRHRGCTNLQADGWPPVEILEALITCAYPQFVSVSRVDTRRGHNSRGHCETDHVRFCKEAGRNLAKQIHAMWPETIEHVQKKLESPDTAALHTVRGVMIDLSIALKAIRPVWNPRSAVHELSDFINLAQSILDNLPTAQDTSVQVPWRSLEPCFKREEYTPFTQSVAKDILTLPYSTLHEFIIEPPPVLEGMAIPSRQLDVSKAPAAEVTKLENILQAFGNTQDIVRKNYSVGLLQSLIAFKARNKINDINIQSLSPTSNSMNPLAKRLSDALNNYVEKLLDNIAGEDRRYSWLRLGNLAPFATPIELFQLLRSTTQYRIGGNLKEVIVSYGVAVTRVQRLYRIDSALKRRNQRAFQDEIHNSGHKNWKPLEYPDWLLLELDNDILIREEQVLVAQEIINPTSQENTVLQLNMGAGKTSCVVPMAIAMLADGTNVSRLLVPKPLLMQTAQMVQSRLGGLVGRQIYSMPFSRQTSTTTQVLQLYERLHQECRARRGLVLTCHEYMLSFKLGGWQRLVDGQDAIAKQMIGFQDWLNVHCRDVLDECDFTLSVKTQLNYPSGDDMHVDGHPYRWQVCEHLLEAVARFLPSLDLRSPRCIEFRWRRGVPKKESFPIFHFLNSDPEIEVHNFIIRDILNGWNPLLRPVNVDVYNECSLVQQVLKGDYLDEKTLDQAARLFVNPLAAVKVLLTVRGLLRNKILVSALNKRWNIQYGLHPSRRPVAVPFEAKGKPSEQAEFGHPDVAILLTCLSFYYGGLTRKQLGEGLSRLLQSDDPASHYERWTSQCTTKWEVPHWNMVNTDDEGQMETMWAHMRYNRTAINDYMNHFVFPKYARQFETKLQACSWDIPLISKCGAKTTGFSGTNDNRMMLPLTIKQNDLPKLQHTSAEVLSYLLQSKKNELHKTTDIRGARLTERGLLEAMALRQIRVLIDAGAYILENDNKSLVEEWLRVDTQAKAGVYFGADNRAWVHFRSDAKDDAPLLATPFVDDLSECLVFIDECHCRGVDLKLPAHARGALTLSLKQTKDFTIQAAMRLRQLRTTQSITFYGPPEVCQSIRDVCRLGRKSEINSSHVVYWLLEQSCRSIEDQQMLYVAQGTDFCRRTDVVWQCRDFLRNTKQRRELLDVLQQPERRTLEELYGPVSEKEVANPGRAVVSAEMQAFISALGAFKNHHHASHYSYHSNTLEVEVEVEQEREVENQIEQIREIQKPGRFVALTFPGLHRSIVEFLLTGRLSTGAFSHAFAYIAATSVGKKFGVHETSSRLFVTDEFRRTVKVPGSGGAINFLRPVEWIIWGPLTETALVVIPEEAELLLKLYQETSIPSRKLVHLISYTAPVTKGMMRFQELGYYSRPTLPAGYRFPDWFARDVGILAGRLYVSQSEWSSMANYVSVSSRASQSSGKPDTIAPNTAAFLLEWLTLRRKTDDILHTPMGKICTGREMDEDEPEEVNEEG